MDRCFILRENYGPLSRYIPLLSFTSRFTYFQDDDMLPGPNVVAACLRFAEAHPDFGVIGQEGRLLDRGHYSTKSVVANGAVREVDFVVRGYFVRTELLHQLMPWRSKLGLTDVREDDLLLCSAARMAGYKIGVMPLGRADEKMNQQELTAPYASSNQKNHASLRDAFVQLIRKHGWRSLTELDGGSSCKSVTKSGADHAVAC